MNVFIDMFFHILFLLVGLVMTLPALMYTGSDLFAYIFSAQFLEFFTIMVGVLVVAKMVLWIILSIFIDTSKMNVWLYFTLESTFVTAWIALVMTSFFSVGILTGTITNFFVLVALVFITGLLGPVVRLVIRGE